MIVHASDYSRCDEPPAEADVGRPIYCHHGLQVHDVTVEELQ
jgi:hypothetical protein